MWENCKRQKQNLEVEPNQRWLCANKSVACLAWGENWKERQRKGSGGRMVWCSAWSKWESREKSDREGEKANLAFGENDLMGWRKGGGRGQPYQPHVQQPRPPSKEGLLFSLLATSWVTLIASGTLPPSPGCTYRHTCTAQWKVR